MGMSNLTIIKLTIITIVIFISGVDGLFQIEKLNNTVEISRRSPVGTVVKTFTVKTTPQVPVAAGFPIIINNNPYSQAFIVTALPPNDYKVVLVESLPQDFPPITQQYELQIYAEDIRGDTDMKTLVVKVTEESGPLKFLDNLGNQDVLIYIEERTNPGLIYQPHVYHLGKNNLTYSLAPSTPEFFYCDSTNGFIYSLKPFRFDKDPHSYILMLNVSDGTYIISGRIIVYIVNTDDGTIKFTQFSCTYPGSEGKMNISTTKTCTIPEELLPGTEVARISAQDPDDFNFLTILHYSMTGSTNFSINPLTGAIQVTERIDRDTPPYKNKALVPLHVTVRNTLSGKSAETEITFNIMDLNDMPPKCTPQVYWVSITPKHKLGKEIVNLNCTDHDVDEVNKEFTFCCLFSVGNNFGLNVSNQSVTLTKELQYDSPSNFTSAHEYSLSIIVRDTAFPFYQTTAFVIIEVIPEDEPSLVFTQSPYVFNISEASGGGTHIGRIQVKDQHLHLSNLTFSISSPPNCPYPDMFWLDSLNGNLQLIMRPDWLQHEVLECVFDVTATYHGPQQLYSNVVKVIVHILPANVNPPVCNLSSNVVPVSVDTPLGDTILIMTCTDKDSGPRSMRYTISSGNVNNHFSLSPAAGTNQTNLVLAEPFVFSEGLDKIWNYRLIVYITDDNLLAGVPGPKGLVQTGSVTITLDVYNPNSTTTPSTTQDSFIYMKMTKNSYSLHAWYVPFVIVVASVLLLGLLGYLIKHACCDSSPDASKELLLKQSAVSLNDTENRSAQTQLGEVIEAVSIATIFDGEAADPVTGKVYEYNSQSGARRWKETENWSTA